MKTKIMWEVLDKKTNTPLRDWSGMSYVFKTRQDAREFMAMMERDTDVIKGMNKKRGILSDFGDYVYVVKKTRVGRYK